MSEYTDAVRFEGVSRSKKGCLYDVGFSVPKGTVMLLVGENGAGKTTLLNVLTGQYGADHGTVYLFDRPQSDDDPTERARMSVVFDTIPYGQSLNAKQVGKVFAGLYPQWDDEAYNRYLDIFGIGEKQVIKTYSRGMMQKLQIACALSHNAELLVLDEPTANLDPGSREIILQCLMEYMKDGERSILVSTNMPGELDRYADGATMIHKGRVVFSGEIDTILNSYGIVKCGPDEVSGIDRPDIVGIRHSRYSAEVMVKDRERVAARCPGMAIDPATLDDILVFTGAYGEEAAR